MSNGQYDDVLSPHPVLNKLASGQGGNTDLRGAGVVVLSGYVGAAEDPSRLRFYRSLANLEFWIEISRSDIVHAAIANQELQSVTVWLQSDANVVHAVHRKLRARELPIHELTIAPSSTIVSDEPLASMSDSDMIPISKGRLRMLLQKQGVEAMMPMLCCSDSSHGGKTGPTGPA